MTGENNGHRHSSTQAPSNTARATNFPNMGASGTSTGWARTFGTFRNTSLFADAGIRAGEIIGYRAWRLYDPEFAFSKLLVSAVQEYYWHPHETPPAVNFAEAWGGFYAFKTMDRIKEEMRGWGNKYFPMVLGSVYMWGTVYEHSQGYRSEYAYPRSFDLVTGYQNFWSELWHGEHLKRLRKLYLE